MPKAPRNTKKQTCKQCKVEKLSHGNFTPRSETCLVCARGVDRDCASCHQHKAAIDFSDGLKKNCRDCNSHKETAEHVDVCAKEGCQTVFSRNPDTFTWRSRPTGGNWNANCKRCCAPKPKEEYTQCSECHELKHPDHFNHGLKCKACRSEREQQHRKINCEQADLDSTDGKPCTKCGADFSADNFRRQGDRWSSWCKPCYNSARYYATWRSNRLAEDPAAYREHNNAVLRKWRSEHPASVAAYQLRQKTDPSCIWKRWLRQSQQRGIEVALDEADNLQQLFCQECFYCGYLPPAGAPLNTLDRVDNDVRLYSMATCVPCCVPCNWLKGSKSVAEFLQEAVEFAAAWDGDLPEDRMAIDGAFRALGIRHHSKDTMPTRQEQLLFVARHKADADRA